MNDAAELDQGPSWPVKMIVLLTLAMLLIAGTATIEAWPFTGWRLYSNMKGPTAGSFIAYRVGPQHGEHIVDYDELPYAYQRTPYVLDKFPRTSASAREAACAGIAQGEREAGRPVREIRIYWEKRRVVPVDGERRTKLIERDLRYTCARSSA